MDQRIDGWRTPGVIIGAGCLIVLITFGVRAGFGLWLEPMSREFGWGREVFAAAVAIQNLIWGLAQPFAGAIADKYGAGRMLLLGGAAFVAGVYLMAGSSTPGLLDLSLGLLVGLGMAGASFGIVLAAFGRLVPEDKRSLALGLGTAAGSVGQFLLVPLGQQFMSAFGWSNALLALSAVSLLVIPLSGVLAGRPREHGAGLAPQSVSAAIREAGRHRGYWLLVAGFYVCGFHIVFIQTHMPAYLTDLGLPVEAGAWSLATVGLFNIVGAFGAGVLGGRYSKKSLLSLLYLLRSAAIALFVLSPPSMASALAFSAAIGLLWLSTVPLTSGIVAQIFGPRHMGMLFGFVFLSHQLGSFTGVWLGGYLYDATGSYEMVWWISIALGIAAALLHWPIDERRLAPAAAKA